MVFWLTVGRTHPQEDLREAVQDGLHKLQPKGPGHLSHTGQPVRGVSVHQVAQVLVMGKYKNRNAILKKEKKKKKKGYRKRFTGQGHGPQTSCMILIV